MKILAIDPGSEQSAYVLWDGCSISAKGIIQNREMSLLVAAERAITLHCDLVAIEQIQSYGMAVGAEIFETCVWTGRFMQAWLERRPESTLVRIPRKDIKIHLCGTTKAKDGNIRQALIDRLGAPGVKKAQGVTYGIKADEWAALAVAVTVFDRLKCGIRGAA